MIEEPRKMTTLETTSLPNISCSHHGSCGVSCNPSNLFSNVMSKVSQNIDRNEERAQESEVKERFSIEWKQVHKTFLLKFDVSIKLKSARN